MRPEGCRKYEVWAVARSLTNGALSGAPRGSRRGAHSLSAQSAGAGTPGAHSAAPTWRLAPPPRRRAMSASPAQQKAKVHELRKAQLKEGEAWHLVSARWWRQWAEHVQFEAQAASHSVLREEAPAPPAIDNSDLLADGDNARRCNILSPNLVEGDDYELLPAAAWEYLHGLYEGGPECRREVVRRGTELAVDRYPLIVTVEALDAQGARTPGAAQIHTLSRDLVARDAVESLGAKGAELRVWAHRQGEELVLTDGEAMSASVLRGWRCLQFGADDRLGDLQIQDGQTLLLERRDFGEWRFEAAVLQAMGSEHWKDPATDTLEPGDPVDYRSAVNDAWLSAAVVAVGSGDHSGEVQLTCAALARGDDASRIADDLARMSLVATTSVETGPDTPWVRLDAGRLAKWHTHELPTSDNSRRPFGRPRDLRAGDECDVQCDGKWASGTVRSVNWLKMTTEINRKGGSSVTVTIEGDDIARPGSMTRPSTPLQGRAGTAASNLSQTSSMSYVASPLPEQEELGGICGLSNLGNTCFMNSALQALSNTPSWRDYFLSGRYEEEINVDNPLGYKGRLAREFGGLMKEIWSNRHSSVSPSTLKRAVSDANAMFAGYQQHDSHELLSFLLDAIHEDLNRVKKKESTEAPEHDGSKDDNEVAREAWEIHLKRNRSVVVDHFQGQLRSEATCLKCDRTSIKFDETMYLSVPLPKPTTKTQEVFVVRNTEQPDRSARACLVEVPLGGVIEDLRTKLSEITGIAAAHLYVCEVYQSRVYKKLEDTSKISAIARNDKVFAYQMPEGTDSPVQVQLRKPGKSAYGGPDRFAFPLVLGLPAGCTSAEVRARMQALGNSMLKPGQAERFLRMQEAAALELGPALAKALELKASGDAKLAATEHADAITCFTEAMDILANHVANAVTQKKEDEQVQEAVRASQACQTGRAECNIALAEAETDTKRCQQLLDEAVDDCEAVLDAEAEDVRALFLRGRCGALRADGLVALEKVLRELRYAKGLFWKAGELARDDEKIAHERVEMNKRLEEREAAENDVAKLRSFIVYENKREDDVEVHWVRSAEPFSTKKMAVVAAGKDYRSATKMGDRFVVYKEGTAPHGDILHDHTITVKPNREFLHEDGETQNRLKCDWLWKEKGGYPSEADKQKEQDARKKPSSAVSESGPYSINTCDPARSEKGRPLPNDDEPFTAGTNVAICLDWTAAGLEARDASNDSAENNDVGRAPSLDGALRLQTCIDKFCEKETLSEDDPWFCPRCKVRT